MINRNYLICCICGAKAITRTALGHSSYQEFAFPCSGCGVEIRFGMELKPPDFEYVKLINAEWILPDDAITDVKVFDSEHLIPHPRFRDFSPFLATTRLLTSDRMQLYFLHTGIRHTAIYDLWPKIERMILHFRKKHWDLFDKQYRELYDSSESPAPHQRHNALYVAIEQYSKFARPVDESAYQFIKERIGRAMDISEFEANNLINYFKTKGKDIDIDHQLQDLRRRWAVLYSAVAPIYIVFYWDDKEHKLSDFTVAQKRFDELKAFYVDCFETFCRISVIAAAIEGIVSTGMAVVPKSNGTLPLDQYDNMNNGSKPDIIRGWEIADLFIPYIEHRLRNGIGHHSAKYDVAEDKIEYVVKSRKNDEKFNIPYILFCEKVIKLYGQLELVSLYSNWLQLFSGRN